MKPKIGIIGDGNVGTSLKHGLERAGYPVRAVGKEPAGVKEAGEWAEVLVLAVPSRPTLATVASVKSFAKAF